VLHPDGASLRRILQEVSRCSTRGRLGRWRRLKGIAMVRLKDGTIRKAELHWYEAAGIGRKELKIKRYLP